VALLVLPSLGSRLVPEAVIGASSPAATVVHLLGDEVAPAPVASTSELRTRLSAPTLLPFLGVVAAAGAFAAAQVAGGVLRARRVPVPVAAPRRSLPARAPPAESAR
jgi:hypothetical protein